MRIFRWPAQSHPAGAVSEKSFMIALHSVNCPYGKIIASAATRRQIHDWLKLQTEDKRIRQNVFPAPSDAINERHGTGLTKPS
jgi:hypothetical protein